MPAGRPTTYKPEYCEQLIAHMESGLSYESFAGIVGCAVSTIYEWEKKNPEFSEAKREGFARNMVFWEKMGLAGAAGKIKNFNCTAWVFNMKNRHKWRDRHEHYEAETADEFNYPEGFGD